jgi:phosphatidylserine decarboxylase
MRQRSGPARILEVGPGTGAVTVELLRQLGPEDHLDLVEVNEYFVNLLLRRFEQDNTFRAHRWQVEIIHAPLQEVTGSAGYDYMISGLPLNNFPLSLVREIFHAYERLLKPGGVLSYFEYLWIRTLKKPFVTGRERQRLHVLTRFLARRISSSEFRRNLVFLNLPPAVARHLRFGAAISHPAANHR